MSFTTKKTLLEKIQANDEVSWAEFRTAYSPLIRLIGHDLGLNLNDRNDLVQEVMIAVFKMQKNFHYDPARGKFRNYLRTLVVNCAYGMIRERKIHPVSVNVTPEEFETVFDRQWNKEWELHLLEEALNLLESRMEALSYQAFRLYALEGNPPQEVARALAISLNSVYLAKSRGVAILRENLKYLKELQNATL